ncbi:MAG TPA: iron-sulfur cluster assembly accessory protein [Cyanobacteria bacterium UBA11149]|nr:iron-sulfur cluster assembly accessory protein [Cyanobacteria bacterium UBA11367]HBE57228.1 iron-sulfur cluster assembly accessory protein [Cyanobacteria bacterium UBA11366]HBK65665.1 iron-sulfur cluster assembly accessory protein [Cyanobacteria bacterium UBA11166]HBR74641.1 iron-sulfur cluster assembly accessory protein [Cyanobacteria bacterium UBA11159]HBS71316.1 iron-sulfur cluster assembly accessory protein [Cyanobacteria bacterium UBA11153]HBW88359.1 iron-sulfur cluster assembly access
MITLSKAAINEIKRLKLKRQNPEAKLRLGVQPGGCADFYYTMDLDETVKEGDRISDCGDITVIVDEQSCQYIADLSLDYSEDLMGGGFRFHNPKAVDNCGCGNSFRVQG